jgi:formylmethanofuran dehydrogenase subunit E
MNMDDLRQYLAKSASSHKKLCPRQVLGVRMGRYAAQLLGFDPLEVKKRLLVIVETDGCFATGVSTATGCTIGSRNLRVEDYGKAAATFTDTKMRRTVRIAPTDEARALAREFAADVSDRWEAMLEAYQRIPYPLLFSWQPVELSSTIEAIFSKPGVRTSCVECGEEIMNEREVVVEGRVVCRSCAGFSYYTVLSARLEIEPPRTVSLGGNGTSRTGDTKLRIHGEPERNAR